MSETPPLRIQPGPGQPGPGQPASGQPRWLPPGSPAPGGVPLRPLGVGEILSGSFTLIRRNPGSTLGLGVILLIALYSVIIPVEAGALVLVYADLRMRKEGLDLMLQQTAARQARTGAEFATISVPPAAGEVTA